MAPLLRQDIKFPDVTYGSFSLKSDERGGFRRLIDEKLINDFLELNKLSSFHMVQSNFSTNSKSGTWRGLHAQHAPNSETKFVTCVSGSILDVFLDFRKDSATFLQIGSIRLDSSKGDFVIIPKGFAHGYLTLLPESSVVYFVDAAYDAKSEFGINILDPQLSVSFRDQIRVISDKDKAWPILNKAIN